MTSTPPASKHGEYEPTDSRDVTRDKSGKWREKEKGDHRGEYEPADSRNVTRPGETESGNWHGEERRQD